MIASAGTASTPLDGHEALVVQTAQEMHDRREWIVPYFNGEPRLKKPPLSYWLVRAIAELAGGAANVQPWHGRIPSIAAGLGLLAVTLLLGATLFDRTTAVIAGGLLVASVGFFSATHDARADALYSFWCALMIAGFAHALTAPKRTPGRIAGIYGMWAALGLATLTKGPHVPVMLLAAFAIVCALRGPGLRGSLELLRPLSGSALAAALSVPWWVALHARVGAKALQGSEVTGALIAVDWRNALGLYYLPRALIYALPWFTLLPAAMPLAWRRQLRTDGVLLLGLLFAIPVAALQAGAQKRPIYVLPALVPLILLLAAGLAHFIRTATPQQTSSLTRWLVPIHTAVASIVLAWVAISSGSSTSGRLIAGLLVAWTALTFRALRRRAPQSQAAVALILTALAFAAAAGSDVFYRQTRYDKVRLAGTMRKEAGDRVPLAAIGVRVTPYVYYTARHIEVLASGASVEGFLARAGSDDALMIVAGNSVASLPDTLEYDVIDRFDDDGDAVKLLRVRRANAR